MNKKILVIGSATIDLIFQGAVFSQRKKDGRLSLADGGKYIVDNLYQSFGGGGANAAVSLARQGFPVWLWARLACDDFGKNIMQNLQKEGVGLDFIQRDLPRSPVSAILLDTEGSRTIINYRSQADILDFSGKVKEAISGFACLAIFSLARWPKERKLEVLKLARQYGLRIFLSLHGDEYRQGLSWVKDYFPFCDILDINIFELGFVLGRKPADLDLDKENFSQILGVPMVTVTHDTSGSHFYSQEEIFWQSPLEAKRVDTTGAGDAFSAGFLGKYLKTGNTRQSMEFAAQNAKAEIEVLGAQTGLLYDK